MFSFLSVFDRVINIANLILINGRIPEISFVPVGMSRHRNINLGISRKWTDKPPYGVAPVLWRRLKPWAEILRRPDEELVRLDQPACELAHEEDTLMRLRQSAAEVARDMGASCALIHDPDLLPADQSMGWIVSWMPSFIGDLRQEMRHDLVMLSDQGRLSTGCEWTVSSETLEHALALTKRSFRLTGGRLPNWDEMPLFLPPLMKRWACAMAERAVELLMTQWTQVFKQDAMVDVYRRIVAGHEYARLIKAVRPLMTHLDQGALRVCLKCGGAVRLYDRLVLSRHRDRRIQAGNAYPLLANAMMRSKELVTKVDAALPIVPALASHFSVGEPHFKRFVGMGQRDIPLLNDEDPVRLLIDLSVLDPGLRARRRSDWLPLLALWRAEDAYRLVFANRKVDPLIRQARGKWAELAQSITDAGGTNGEPLTTSTRRVFLDAFDVLRGVARALVVPVWAAVVAECTGEPISAVDLELLVRPETVLALASEMVFGRLSPAKLARRSAECQARVGLLEALVDDRRWGAPFEMLETPEKIMILPLNSSGLLREEGRTMCHCVGGYDSACDLYGHHILSLRTREGKRLSTAEVIFPGPGPGIEVIQHSGSGNSWPPKEAQAALMWLSAEIKADRIKIDHVRLEQARQLRRHYESARKAAGGIVRLSLLAQALAIWRPHLERPWSRFDPLAFVEAVARRAKADCLAKRGGEENNL